MLNKIVASSTAIAAVVLWVLLVKTAPVSAGPIGILVVFILMYVTAWGMLTFLLHAASAIAVKALRPISNRTHQEALTFRKSYYYASVVALAPVMLIAMQSVNEVGLYQLLLVGLFVAIAWVYITKRMT